MVQVKSKHCCHLILKFDVFFSTEFTKLILKPCGEISITLDGNNVCILLEPLTYVAFNFDTTQENIDRDSEHWMYIAVGIIKCLKISYYKFTCLIWFQETSDI